MINETKKNPFRSLIGGERAQRESKRDSVAKEEENASMLCERLSTTKTEKTKEE